MDNSHELLALYEQAKRLGPAAIFPWHTQQQVLLRAATDSILAIGGNRSGKSIGMLGVVSRLVRREGPIYKRLRKPDGRPLQIAVAPDTDEQAMIVWEPRLIDMFGGKIEQYDAGHAMDFDYVASPHRVFTWHDELGGGKLYLKSQQQGFRQFEAMTLDAVVLDEEPEDRRLYHSARTRLATTNGVIVFGFTPLKGATWSQEELYDPTVRPEYAVQDRVWRRGNSMTVVKLGMADNPEALAGGGVYRIENDPAMTRAEKNARLYGDYGFVEGMIFPEFASLTIDTKESPYLIETLPKDRTYKFVLTCDPNKRHGALLTALDHEGNRYYCAEHYAEALPDPEHARAYSSMLAEFSLRKQDVEMFGDPGGAGSQALINMAELGFDILPVPKDPGSVAASIKRLRRAAHIDPEHRHPVTGRLGAPHVYFLRSLRSHWRVGGQEYYESRLIWELRKYRQMPNKAPDTPIKKDDDVVDCARYFELAHLESPEFEKPDTAEAKKRQLDPLSRKEADEYDAMLKRIERKGGRVLT